MNKEFNDRHNNISWAVQQQCAAGCVSTVDEFCDDPEEAIGYSVAALEMWRARMQAPDLSQTEADYGRACIEMHNQRIRMYQR